MEPRKLYALLDEAGDAAFAVDPRGVVCYWSEAAERLLGFSRESVLSRPCEEILVGKDDHGCAVCGPDCAVLEIARKTRPVTAFDLHAATASGQRKWLSVSILVARMRRGPSPLTVHLLRDIDRRKKAERLSREIVARLSELSGQQAVAHLGNGLPDQPLVSLTPREISALSLLSQGRSTRQMAGELDITLATARNHVQRALRKLRCHSRLEAVLRATRLGLI